MSAIPTVRRFWERYGVVSGLIALAIGAGLVVRQTQAAPLAQLFGLLSQPFNHNIQKTADSQQATLNNPRQLAPLVNAQVVEMQQRLVELESQNEQLQSLLNFRKQYSKGQGLAVPVIGRSADHWWQQVTLGQGQDVGISENQIVMAPGGVVGYIESATANTSRVVLISDANSQTGVVVSRSRATGFMRGIGNNRAVMEFFDKVPDVRKGDAIAISSLSKKYPKGLPVGRVESIDLYKSPAPEATIELSAPIRTLEWVMVYPSPPILDNTPESRPTSAPTPNVDGTTAPTNSVSPRPAASPANSPNP
jgi:rod shape-determining protein MreC